MAELETVQTVPENQPLPETEPTKTEKFKAGVKERFRKFIVKLKHKPHIIPLVILLITSIVYLCILNSLSYLVSKISGVDSAGICIFVNTLASILVLLVFLNAFPKRKKPNIVMIVITFVVMALIFALDLVFYFKDRLLCQSIRRHDRGLPRRRLSRSIRGAQQYDSACGTNRHFYFSACVPAAV